MPTFDTPEPIVVTIDISVANVRFVASERTDTVVEVRPTNENEPSDVKAAEQVRVEYSGGTLLIKGKNPRPFDFSSKSWSVDLTVELPEGSQVQADASVGDFQSTGRLGECRFKSSVRARAAGPDRAAAAEHLRRARLGRGRRGRCRGDHRVRPDPDR